MKVANSRPPKPAQIARRARVDLVAVNERMASLILVLREGAIKQAAVGLEEEDAVDQPTLNRVAVRLNDLLAGRTASAAESALGRLGTEALDRVAKRVGERIVRIVREYDAAMVEEVFSDGLLNVMAAPEFAQSDKLRQVFGRDRATMFEMNKYLAQHLA